MNENDEIVEITTKLEWNDYKRLNKLMFFQSTYFKILFAFSIVLPLYDVIVFLCGCKLDLACHIYILKIKTPPILPIVLFTFFLIPLVILLRFVIHHIAVKKYWNSNKKIQEEIKRIFSIEGIQSQANTASGFISWADIYEVKEYKEDLSIFISTIESFIIPKRFFKSDEDLQKVKEIIKQKVDPKKLKLLKNEKNSR